MPALPPAPSVIRLEFLQTLNATTNSFLRLHFEYSGSAPTVAQLNTFATACFSAWGTNVSPSQSIDTVLTEVTAVDLTSSSSAAGSHSGSQAGGIASDALPADTSFLVGYTIPRRYRGGKPRSYLNVGAIGDLQNSQTWTTGFVAGITSAWNALIAACNAAVWTGGGSLTQVNVGYYGPPNITITNPVTHRSRTVSTTLTAPNIDAIVSTTYSGRIASQRRRSGRKR